MLFHFTNGLGKPRDNLRQNDRVYYATTQRAGCSRHQDSLKPVPPSHQSLPTTPCSYLHLHGRSYLSTTRDLSDRQETRSACRKG